MQRITERFMLREFVEEDCLQIHPYCSDEEVTRYTFWGPNTEEQTRQFFDAAIQSQFQLPRTTYEMVIADSSTGEVVGNCCLKAEKSNAELGYNISKAHWGKGIATEAARSMLEFGFQELKLHRIYATCRPENTGSYRVMENIGMKREGHLREHFMKNGMWQDSYLYSILESEYVGRRDKGELT